MSSSDIISTLKDKVRLIRLNRPDKKNAITVQMYETLANILHEDALNDEVVVTILTGTGDYFSSGNDVKSAIENYMKDNAENNFVVKQMVEAFINYPKIIIAVVNGPAIGIGTTILALCDVVYATDRATFLTPFVNLGLCAEAASSFTFSRILGRSKASEMLLLNQQLTVEDALQLGFISKIIPHANLDDFINQLYKLGKLPVEGVKVNKALMMAPNKHILQECNYRECKEIFNCIARPEFSEAALKFMSRKSKL